MAVFPPSFLLAAAFSFVQNFSSALLTNSLGPYLKLLDPETTEDDFDYIVSAASVIGLISNIVCGLLATRNRDVSIPLACGIICMVLGNTAYLFVHNYDGHYKRGVLLSRLLCGLSAGNSCLISTFVAVFAARKQLSRAIAMTSCGSTLGMLLGPAFQNIFTLIGYPGYTCLSFQLNQYNAPAVAAIVINVLALFAVPFLRMQNRKERRRYSSLNEKTEWLVPQKVEKNSWEGTKRKEKIFRAYGYKGVPLCLATRYVQNETSIAESCGNSTYIWCGDTPPVSTARFYLPYYLLITVAMCVLSLPNSTCLTLFAGKHYQQTSSYCSSITWSIIIGKSFASLSLDDRDALPHATGSMALIWAAVAVLWSVRNKK